MRRGRREGAFTLIEVLVAIALLAVFLGGIYTVAISSMKAKRAIEQTAAIYTAGPEILDLIDRDLRATYIYDVQDHRGLKAQRQSVGGYEVTILDLITTTNSKTTIEVDDRVVRSDVTEVGYRLRESSDFPGYLELYRREQFFFDDDPLKGGNYFLVYDRVRSLTIDFFEPQDEEGDTVTSSTAELEGLEDWDSEKEEALPRSAKITLELGAPAELGTDLESDDRVWTFVRWVLLPNAYDVSPGKDEGPGDGGNGR